MKAFSEMSSESMNDDDDDEVDGTCDKKKKKKKKQCFDALTSSLNGWGLLATTRSEKHLSHVFKTVHRC